MPMTPTDEKKKPQGLGLGAPKLGYEGARESVSGEVAKVIDKGGPLMKQAETRGLQAANRRGLINSSMAVGEAQSAVLDAATPIAQQQASQNFQRNQSHRDFKEGIYQQGQEIAFREREGAAGRMLSREQQQADITSREGLAAQDRSLQEKLASWNVDEAERQGAVAFLADAQRSYAAEIQSVMQNTSMKGEDRDAYLREAEARNRARINLMEQMYNTQVDWNFEIPGASRSAGGGNTGRNASAGGSSTRSSGRSSSGRSSDDDRNYGEDNGLSSGGSDQSWGPGGGNDDEFDW